MSRDSIDVFCPHCNVLVQAEFAAQAEGAYQSHAINEFDAVDAIYNATLYLLATCPRCYGAFLYESRVQGVPGEFEVPDDLTLLFPRPNSDRIDGLPQAVENAMEQAQRSFTNGSYDASALMCRRAMEVVCKHLSASGRTLVDRLAALQESGHIDKKLLSWAHGVRMVGNEAAHDVERSTSKEDARDILDLTQAILMYVFSLDRKFRAFEARRKSVQEGERATGNSTPCTPC